MSRGAPGQGTTSKTTDSTSDSAFRARAQLRRYAVHNRLELFATCTYAKPAESLDQALADSARLVRKLRDASKGNPLPWIRVIEGLRRDERIHLHFLLPTSTSDALTDSWPHGRVDEGHRMSVEDIRCTALYISKTFFTETMKGRQRYGCAQGFAPERIRLSHDDRESLLRDVFATMGGQPLTFNDGPSIALFW